MHLISKDACFCSLENELSHKGAYFRLAGNHCWNFKSFILNFIFDSHEKSTCVE